MIFDLVPMAHVASVDHSIAFYEKLGFTVRSRMGTPCAFWASMQSGSALLMLARASGHVEAEQQAVLFYLYTRDLVALRKQLATAGVVAEPTTYPDYMPEGEMRVMDPDGYCLLIGQSDCWTRP